MCLEIRIHYVFDKQEFLKSHREPFYAYKLVSPEMVSIFEAFEWKVGENVSDREIPNLTRIEWISGSIYKGFHLALNKPDECPRAIYADQHHIICKNPYVSCSEISKYRCPHGKNKLLRCRIDPKDLVAVGIWENLESIVVTKAFVEEEE